MEDWDQRVQLGVLQGLAQLTSLTSLRLYTCVTSEANPSDDEADGEPGRDTSDDDEPCQVAEPHHRWQALAALESIVALQLQEMWVKLPLAPSSTPFSSIKRLTLLRFGMLMGSSTAPGSMTQVLPRLESFTIIDVCDVSTLQLVSIFHGHPCLQQLLGPDSNLVHGFLPRYPQFPQDGAAEPTEGSLSSMPQLRWLRLPSTKVAGYNRLLRQAAECASLEELSLRLYQDEEKEQQEELEPVLSFTAAMASGSGGRCLKKVELETLIINDGEYTATVALVRQGGTLQLDRLSFDGFARRQPVPAPWAGEELAAFSTLLGQGWPGLDSLVSELQQKQLPRAKYNTKVDVEYFVKSQLHSCMVSLYLSWRE